MDNGSDEILSIINHIKAANLKGKTDFGADFFSWDLGNVHLCFLFDSWETTVMYYGPNRLFSGHFHRDNEDVIDLIDKINSKDTIIAVTFSLLGSKFEIKSRTDRRKRSNLFVLRYYSEL